MAPNELAALAINRVPFLKPREKLLLLEVCASPQQLATYRATVSRLKNEYNSRVALAKKANKNFPAGIIVMGTLADSGRTFCEFNNAWLWLMAP